MASLSDFLGGSGFVSFGLDCTLLFVLVAIGSYRAVKYSFDGEVLFVQFLWRFPWFRLVLIFFNYPADEISDGLGNNDRRMIMVDAILSCQEYMDGHLGASGSTRVSVLLWCSSREGCSSSQAPREGSFASLVISSNVAWVSRLCTRLFPSFCAFYRWLVVRSAVIQKFLATTILSKSAFLGFSPDAYVCCDPTDEVSYGCGHLVGTRCGLEEVKFFFSWGSFCLLIYVEVSFGSSSCNLCSVILCGVAISLVYVESNVTSQMVSVKTYLLSPPSPNRGRAGSLFLMVRDVDGGSKCARFYSGNSSSLLLPVVLSDLVGFNFLPGAGFFSMNWIRSVFVGAVVFYDGKGIDQAVSAVGCQ
ncbi:hypothetical protein MTR67_018465 [Solanum verrucosum]|uniref:Uncharacterized protein n=1 Tax=Solanum verrucosum TaxID=315347 RepID=A0AAF0QPU4_SOLVR|nr:hypothetical protein MTR67_018465 [Solanum verrucosum]